MSDFLNVALPKGRLGEKVYAMFAKAGFPCDELLDPKRKLIFENPEAKVRYFWVKPSDVAVYVERGAADVGVVGKDILLEYEPDIYELLAVPLPGSQHRRRQRGKALRHRPRTGGGLSLRQSGNFSELSGPQRRCLLGSYGCGHP